MVSCQMDRGPSLFSLCGLIYCVFQTVPFSIGDESACPCPKIPPVNLTEAPPTDCFQIDAKFRYKCKAGYVRKAGRSNLITCILKGHRAEWTQPDLLCIRDPKIGPTTKPTNPPLISDHTEFLNVSITSTTVTKTASVDPTWTSPTTSDSLPAGTSGFAIGGTNAPQGGKNNPPDFASQPKYIVSLCVGLVCVVALVGGLIYIFFFKSRASPAEQPLSAEQIPLGKRPIGVDGSPRFFN
uniref:IL-15 receptor alpha chain n=1 Tax=Tetraodon nigroviridis TaxID=99883 RepID=A1YYP4_TETNG|nr:IL-15 receptor alpha chain [Tetraodon nigroviridis]ABO15460.1 interleukin 15 receptor alpha [Tetraodon nigroviridis]